MKFRVRDCLVFCCLATWLAALAAPTAAGAAPVQDPLVKFGSHGSGAGQFERAVAIATSPVNGHVFVGDAENVRVDEFTPWGVFVKAFGWDVAPGAVNEQQEVVVKASAGQFTLTFDGSTTDDLNRDAPASEAEGPGSVEAALDDLASVSSGGGGVTVEKGPSDGSSSRYVVSFTDGPVGASNVDQLTAASGTVPLTSGAPVSSVSVATRADGTTGGTGLESCTAESGCQAGSIGPGAGQLDNFQGIAVDSNGAVYVRTSSPSEDSRRVQKFDSAGRFVWMIGGEVDKTTGENLCTAESAHQCGEAVSGTAPGEFSAGLGLALDADGRLLVSDSERLQAFAADGSFVSAIPLPGKVPFGLAVDPSDGELFTRFGNELVKLSSSGAALCNFTLPRPEELGSSHPLPNPGAFAVNPSGGLYVSVANDIAYPVDEVFYFSGACPAGNPSIAPLLEFLPNFRLQSIAVSTVGDLFVGRSRPGSEDFIQVYGPPPVTFEPPPAVPPAIADQYTINTDPEDATVRAEINPHFWTDTHYYVEYGTGKCSEGNCESKQPLPPGARLTTKVAGDAITSGGVLLQELDPGTTYHYRFVAQSGGGGPVRGVGGEVDADGSEGTFRTPPLPDASQTGCPNPGFRVGPSAVLPDCRAYEMVSPVDKNNGDIRDRLDVSSISVGLRQSALDGDSVTYSSYRAFANPVTGPYSAQYLARRGVNGWSTEGLAHARTGRSVLGGVYSTENEFKAFSPDLCSLWVVDPSSVPYAAGALENFPNLYRRKNCPVSYEGLTTARPPGPEPSQFTPAELQGFSADGAKSIFVLPYKVASGAVENKYQAYEASGGGVRLICVLPNESPLGGGCSAGMGVAGTLGPFSILINRGGSLSHAISADGSRIYWTASENGPGKIYLRIGGAATVEVSGTETAAKSEFLGASDDGSSALFLPTEKTKAGKLFQYSLEAENSSEIAGEVLGVAGASEDLSYVYFVSKEAIGGEGIAGESNLYLHHAGTNTFIATLAGADVETNAEGHYSDIATQPVYRVARATPDGRHIAFSSTMRLTGYGNTDFASGKADFEVFQYTADTKELNCVSCSPGGSRPRGRLVQAPVGASAWFAALIPAGETQLYTPRSQSEDGNRIFFNSYGPLVARDTNGVADVYEWEALGTGGCTEGASAFSPANGGCIYLISSGSDAADSELVDTSADGRDVFIATNDSLLPQDPGLVDIYDARENGGFPVPPPPPASCEGEACQGPSAPSSDPTPGSSSFDGAGNVREGPTSTRCPKGKARRKGRCRVQHRPAKKHSHRSAKSQGRAGK